MLLVVSVKQHPIDYAVYGGYGPVLYANNASLSTDAVEAISPSTWSVALVASCDDTGCGTPDEDGACALGCVAQAGACVRECEPITVDAATAPTCAEVYVASGLTPRPAIEACH